ncbi:MAG: hypothetical protein RLZZ516_1146 [Cyanobacteriota bacterium]
MTVTAERCCRWARDYRTPELLQDIRLLDLLELSGTTVKAGALLNLSQPTVSRRYRKLAEEFALERQPRQRKTCRYGSTDAMRWLRLGYRAHRLAAGVARIGADLMHQPLLAGMDWLLTAPPRFRSIDTWVELVSQGVLDGAIVSGLEFQGADVTESRDVDLLRLGRLPLTLMTAAHHAPHCGTTPPAVLVPDRCVAQGLWSCLSPLGLQLRTAGPTCQNATDWLARLNRSPLAMPMPELSATSWGQPLQQLPLPEPVDLPTWLVLPIEWRQHPTLVQTFDQLRCHPGF